jgi:hypothetical protein
VYERWPLISRANEHGFNSFGFSPSPFLELWKSLSPESGRRELEVGVGNLLDFVFTTGLGE